MHLPPLLPGVVIFISHSKVLSIYRNVFNCSTQSQKDGGDHQPSFWSASKLHVLESIYWVHIYCIIFCFHDIVIFENGHELNIDTHRSILLSRYFSESDLDRPSPLKINFLTDFSFATKHRGCSAHVNLLNNLTSFWKEHYTRYDSLKILEAQIAGLATQKYIKFKPKFLLNSILKVSGQERAEDIWRLRRLIAERMMDILQAFYPSNNADFKYAQEMLKDLPVTLPMKRAPSETCLLQLYERALQMDRSEEDTSSKSCQIGPPKSGEQPPTDCIAERRALEETLQWSEEMKLKSRGLERKESPESVSQSGVQWVLHVVYFIFWPKPSKRQHTTSSQLNPSPS